MMRTSPPTWLAVITIPAAFALAGALLGVLFGLPVSWAMAALTAIFWANVGLVVGCAFAGVRARPDRPVRFAMLGGMIGGAIACLIVVLSTNTHVAEVHDRFQYAMRLMLLSVLVGGVLGLMIGGFVRLAKHGRPRGFAGRDDEEF